MKKLLYILPLIVFFIMVGFFVVGLQKDPRLIPSPLIGKPVPSFSLPLLLKSDQLLTEKSLTGEVSLLNIWATWCPTCRGEHDVLMEIAQTNPVAIYGIDYKDENDQAIRWLEQLGDPYRAVAVDASGTAGINLGVYGTPETFILDKQGIIRYKHVGAISLADWQNTLLPIVKEWQAK